MQLGPISPNTCPECHGVLVKIKQGSIIRYRCHAGHSFSLQTLWGALRAGEERILLLQEMEELARASDEQVAAQQCAEQAQGTAHHVDRIREAVLVHRMFGHVPPLSNQP